MGQNYYKLIPFDSPQISFLYVFFYAETQVKNVVLGSPLNRMLKFCNELKDIDFFIDTKEKLSRHNI